ncbi:Gfo/Idh/MocA family protein [Agromyces sp. ZXT2-6]|uniref:Gfo/Idh/MocA family protein n=1 Tax=Agromyces sp. ZXT2-6 TaxID=3461153 RepID=UPI004054C721
MTPEHRPLRWGVVGTGAISRQMVADFALVPDATVGAVASRQVERADALADEFGIAERYSSRREMFASDIDAVYLATPHVTHFEIASEAIAAGKHVLCEKPLGMNEREVRELSAHAIDAGVFLMEAMWMKFNPLYARLSERIAEGVLGDVRSVRAAFGAAFPRDGSSRWKPGGSALLDQGIYPVTLAHMLLGRPDTVHARGTVRPDGVDLREEFSLGYEDDRFAHGASSMVEWIDPSAAVSGTEAYVTITGGFWWGSQLTVHHPLPWEQRRQEVIEVEREGNGYVPMLRAVVGAIRAGELEHPLHTAAATAAIYSTLDEIRRQITR